MILKFDMAGSVMRMKKKTKKKTKISDEEIGVTFNLY